MERKTEKWIEVFAQFVERQREAEQPLRAAAIHALHQSFDVGQTSEPVYREIPGENFQDVRVQSKVSAEAAEGWERDLEDAAFPSCIHRKLAAVYLAAQKGNVEKNPVIRKMKLINRNLQRAMLGEAGHMAVLWSAFLTASDITVPEMQQRLHRMGELLHHWMDRGVEAAEMNFMVLLFHTDDIALAERILWIGRRAKELDFCCASPEQRSMLAMLAVLQSRGDLTVEAARKSARLLREYCPCFSREMSDLLGTALYLYGQLEGECGQKKNVLLRSLKGDFFFILELICSAAADTYE